MGLYNLVLATGLVGSVLYAQARPTTLSEAAPADQIRASVLAKTGDLARTPENTIAEEVLRGLMATSSARPGRSLPFRVGLLDSGEVNAFTRGNGDVYVYRGLIDLMGSNRGYWAAVLGHEAGHNLAHHV